VVDDRCRWSTKTRTDVNILTQRRGKPVSLSIVSLQCWCLLNNREGWWFEVWFKGGGSRVTDKQFIIGITHKINKIYNSIESHPYSRSSSLSPSWTSGIFATTSTSISLIKLCSLQFPMHKSARVDCAERRLRTCERMRRPRLKTRSTSTEVACDAELEN
jgi:hypothetical protein